MPTFFTRTLNTALTFLGEPLLLPDGSGDQITAIIPFSTVTMVEGRRMAVHPVFDHCWHVGETATPFTITVRHMDGTVRMDMSTATFTLIDKVDGTALINGENCQVVGSGLLVYYPTAPQMDTPCLFQAQYVVTLESGDVLPTFIVEGEIEDSL